MLDHAFDRIGRRAPGRTLDHAQRVCVPGLAARAHAGGGEFNVLGVILAFEARRDQVRDMHRGAAAIGCEFLAVAVGLLVRRQLLRQLPDHVAQPMDLLLPNDVAVGAAGVLDVFLPADHLPDRFGLRAGLVPDVDGEDQRVAPRVVVEYRFDRGVGVDAAVPIRMAVDAHRRKSRRP